MDLKLKVKRDTSSDRERVMRAMPARWQTTEEHGKILTRGGYEAAVSGYQRGMDAIAKMALLDEAHLKKVKDSTATGAPSLEAATLETLGNMNVWLWKHYHEAGMDPKQMQWIDEVVGDCVGKVLALHDNKQLLWPEHLGA